MVKYSIALLLVAASAPAVLASEKKNLHDMEDQKQQEEHQERELTGGLPTYWPTYLPTYFPTEEHGGEKNTNPPPRPPPPPKIHINVEMETADWGAPPAPVWGNGGWHSSSSSSSKSGKGKSWKCASSKGSKVRNIHFVFDYEGCYRGI